MSSAKGQRSPRFPGIAACTKVFHSVNRRCEPTRSRDGTSLTSSGHLSVRTTTDYVADSRGHSVLGELGGSTPLLKRPIEPYEVLEDGGIDDAGLQPR